MKRKTGQKGFTMIELIIVVAIIAILAVVGVSAYGNIQQTAEQNVAKSNAALLAGALNQYNAIYSGTIKGDATSGLMTATILTGAKSALNATTSDIKFPVFSDSTAEADAVANIEDTGKDGKWTVKTGTLQVT